MSESVSELLTSVLAPLRPLISYLRKFYYYDPEEEISPTLKEDKEQKEEKERVTEGGGQLGVESQT